MYQLGQVFTATEFRRRCGVLTKLLTHQPQPFLIMHKCGERFLIGISLREMVWAKPFRKWLRQAEDAQFLSPAGNEAEE